MQEDFAALHRISDAPVAGPSNTSSKQAQLSEPAVASASSKLEPFLVLARSARGPGAAAIVVDQATAAPGVFCFGELLEVPAIAELERSDQHGGKWLLLQIFAYGVLKDYQDNSAALPPLSEAQLSKLKLLTLVDLASKHQTLSYSQLLPALELSSIRQLEDLVIEALYSDLLKARINQKRQVLEVDSVVGRDVKTGSSSSVPFGQEKTVAALIQSLTIWYDRVGSTLSELDYHIQSIKQKEADRIQAEARQSDHIRRTLEEVKKTAASKEKNQRDASYAGNVWQQQQQQQGSWQVRSPGGNSSGPAAVDDLMEVDDKVGKQLKSPGKAANRKRSRP